MLNNYFLLYHSTNYESTTDTLLLNFKDEDFDKISALILTISAEKLDFFLELEEFKKLCKKVIINGYLKTSTLYEFCFMVLQRVTNQPELATTYIDVFNYLYSQSLITKHQKLKLISVFEPLTLNIVHVDKQNSGFMANKEIIIDMLPKVKSLLDSEAILKDIDKLSHYIQEQTFSIGITGVMNVGKSTFINALLSQELLGSSVVAETANLSVIKYSDKPYTRVKFFSKLEFDEMLHTFSDDNERKEYLDKLESSLDIDSYIQDVSLTKDIDRTQLYKYTSASDSLGLSRLVRDVELGVDMDFLKDSIEIVDTPGLDDTLIVRESVTQAYVSNCDLLIHLMNVNQSATKKDVDFIIDAVLNQNVTSILIVLTKADNITQTELSEVINYTKTSIENQFASLDNDSNVLRVLSSLKFISVSAKTALDIRKINQQHKEQEAIKHSGILEVEKYLYKTLFSNNSKNEMIIETAIRRLKEIIESQIKVYNYNLVLYSKDENSLEIELANFNKLKDKNITTCKKINEEINLEYSSFRDFLESVSLDMQSELSSLKSRLLGRVLDEITYALKKEKQELKDIQLKMIIDKTLNHGFIDIVREHKHKLDKKVQTISKNIELSFKAHNIRVDEVKNRFSMQSLFEKNSNSVLATSSKMILKHTLKLSKSIKLSKISMFREELLKALDEEFVYVMSHMQTTLNELNESVCKTFFDALSAPIDSLEEDMSEQESSLEKQIFLLKNRDKDIEELQIQTQNKINSLEAIMEGLS